MSTSSSGFVHNQPVSHTVQVASDMHSAASQHGLGLLLLPRGERVMIMPSGQNKSPVFVPELQPIEQARVAQMNVRTIPLVIQEKVEKSRPDKGVINEIKVLYAELSDQLPEKERQDENKKKKTQGSKASKRLLQLIQRAFCQPDTNPQPIKASVQNPPRGAFLRWIHSLFQ